MAAHGAIAFLADGRPDPVARPQDGSGGGLLLLELSDPAAPRLLATLANRGEVFSVAVNGDYAFASMAFTAFSVNTGSALIASPTLLNFSGVQPRFATFSTLSD